ncbi:MAG: M28 family peptidase [Muriicola sp.]
MIKNFYLIGLLLMAGCTSTQKTTAENATGGDPLDPTAYAATITEQELKDHLYTYASDEFEGRETGTAGQKKAVEYIRKNYIDLGIPAAKSDGNYFQEVPLEMAKLPKGSLNINGKTYNTGEDFITFNALEGTYNDVVYAGFGIEDDNYSDFQDLDVRGKLVLVKYGEPVKEDGTYIITGSEQPSSWSNMSEAPGKRLEVAKAKGAKALFYIDPDNYKRYEGYYRRMKRNDQGRISFKDDGKTPSLILISENMAKEILPEINELKSSVVRNTDISASIKSTNDPVDTENVVAFIKGSEKPDEYLVISSHLDHIGISGDGSINNGADDDGSGTVALLEIAEAFQLATKAGKRPKRSIVFLHVTGEEKGLLGSRYYTDYDPVFPLEQTVANLNIDMIGRIDPKREGDRNYVYLIGSDKLSSELHVLSEDVNKKYTNIELDYTYNDENDPNRFYYRSDHYNFAKNNIPIIFYFNGTHDDYHRPGDTPDKINYDLLTNRTKLVFFTAWAIANRSERVIVDKTSK